LPILLYNFFTDIILYFLKNSKTKLIKIQKISLATGLGGNPAELRKKLNGSTLNKANLCLLFSLVLRIADGTRFRLGGKSGAFANCNILLIHPYN